MRRAVIDVGSNSVLLVVAEYQAGSWRPILESTAVTGLGEGTKATKLLSEPAMARTLEALREMVASAKSLGAKKICAGATMAARIATNTSSFLERAREQSTPVFVVSGEDEAELGFEAVASDPALNDTPRLSIIDPGGHSTELVTADRISNAGWKIRYRRSFPIGTLGLRGDELSNESLGPRDLIRGCEILDETIGLCYLPNQAGRVVVLGATGTNLVSIRDGLLEWEPEKVHGAVLDYEEISRAAGWLSSMTDQERAAVPGMEAGREKTIHLGALILERFLFATRSYECFVSTRGWRHALLAKPDPCPGWGE